MALDGKSLFFTGSAGTGKSFLLRQIIKELKLSGCTVAVTASTGLAALNIGGRTLHLFAAVGNGGQHASILINRAQGSRKIHKWQSTNVLVIDEISMVKAQWFDVLSDIGKILRNNPKPFGGLQLIICGNFFQLAPVPEQSYIKTGIPVCFAFQAREWDWAVPNKFRLTCVFWQHNPKLINMLEEMRIGQIGPDSKALLYTLSREVKYPDGIGPVQLFPLRILADSANQQQMESLPGISMTYQAQDRFAKPTDSKSRFLDPERGRSLLDKMAMIRIGAQVMCTKNLRNTNIVNGSIGRILDFMTPAEAQQSKQFIHIIPSDDPNYKPGTAGPHRGTELYQVHPVDVKSATKKPHNDKDGNFYFPTTKTKGQAWPVVQFDDAVLLATPTLFTLEDVMGRTQACWKQIPLILAWALTMHKAQGQTLLRVKVDLLATFAPGQGEIAPIWLPQKWCLMEKKTNSIRRNIPLQDS
ncbi:unnamed protein product [Rhizoctonia solani]|nr:unnamed protein product [Rhizoctonia solani]